MFLHSCSWLSSSKAIVNFWVGLGFSFSSSIMGSWVIIFTIVIFGVKVGSNSLSYSDEIVNVDLVWDVCVNVVLEVLHHVEVGLDVFVSSNSWEWESSIHKFPGMDSWESSFHLLGNFDGIVVVLFIEVSWEHIHLPLKFFFWDPKFWFAWSISWGKGINDWIITRILKLNSLSGENSEEHNISKFHFY